MDDDLSQQAWWDSDLQKERADEEAFWDWVAEQESSRFHDWLLLEMNKLERSIWHDDV